MYKLQALCVLVLTLLAFSQESPVPSKIRSLQAMQKDVKSLITMDEVVKVDTLYLVPRDVPGNCTVNALEWFYRILDALQKKCNSVRAVTNTIDHIMKNLKVIMGLDPKERKEKSLGYNGCMLSRQPRTATQALEDFTNFLQQMHHAHQ